MTPGQMSDPIESDLGWHIVRVLDRQPAGRKPFTEAQADIRTMLENEQRAALITAELKRLRSAARAWTLFDGDMNGPRLTELLESQNKRR
jgi:parvulin-like peptidyl-prolyl isomerase